jgi:hypothetical protein
VWGSVFTTKTEALQGDVDKFAPGLIRALTLVHSAQAFSRDSGLPDGLKSYYRLRNRGRMVRAADRRADLVPSEYETKAKKTDEAFYAPGSTAVFEALRAIPAVRGIALGAFGELSEPTKAPSRTPKSSARATTRQLTEKSTGG